MIIDILWPGAMAVRKWLIGVSIDMQADDTVSCIDEVFDEKDSMLSIFTETTEDSDSKLLPEKVHRVEWYDRISDIFWIRSIRAFASRRLLPGGLVGGTVLANVLELVEDTYRGVEASNCFRRAFSDGHFVGVKTFLLSLLTVECTTDLGIYTENNRAVINLDDKRLPILLRPAFDQVRSMTAFGGAKALTHKRPARLLHHLHDEWGRKGGLKCLFEEQWIRSTLRYNMKAIKDSDEPKDIETSLLAQERWGYKNRLRMVDREKEPVQSAMESMPEIEPVIIFLKTAFLKCGDVDPVLRERGRLRQWVRGRRYDGLEAISNRRGLALSKYLMAGRRTYHSNGDPSLEKSIPSRPLVSRGAG
ncbi:hypothetical protein DL769_006798 [Monosporascus sp. CRB-8-3]|nr:hypothetical protein DL769_006798 [Monosporascus sp. CRB-8-3]